MQHDIIHNKFISFYNFTLHTGAAKKNFSRAEATVAEINLIVQQTDHRIKSWILAKKSRNKSTPNIHATQPELDASISSM